MQSPAEAVVHICGYPTNFALQRAFLKFQSSSCQTLDAFVNLMHIHMKEECCSIYNGSELELLFMGHIREAGWHRATCDSFWSVQEEGQICVVSRMTTVMSIIRERECKVNIPCALLSRKGTAKLTTCHEQSVDKKWCTVVRRQKGLAYHLDDDVDTCTCAL